MSRLVIRSKDQADEIQLNMPSVSCGICGASAQIPAKALGVEHWDELYDGERGQLDHLLPPRYSVKQWEHDRELEAWSQEHARTHSDAEHEAHAQSQS